MSIFETGVLKALKQATPSDDATTKHAEGSLVKNDNRVTSSRNMSSYIPSDSSKQISNMEQGETYTPTQLNDVGLISSSMKDRGLLNKYRNLRTKLVTSANIGNFSTLVTSITPNSGTSLIACNLAAAFALDKGKTSLLVDANTYNPSLGKILNINSVIGLTDYLESDSISLDDIVTQTPIKRLRLLPNGSQRESASEYFSSEKMEQLLSHLMSRYPERFLVIDAPSIATSADTNILLKFCDKVVLVATYGKFTKDDLKHAVLAVGLEKLAGVVLNEF